MSTHGEHATTSTSSQSLSAEPMAPNVVEPSVTYQPSNECNSQSSYIIMEQLIQKQLENPKLEDNLKEIIDIWDFKWGMTGQSPEVLKHVERILDLDSISLSEEGVRQELTIFIVRRMLSEVLKTYGYESFSSTRHEDQARLRIQPPPGKEKPNLPKWLDIPFIEPLGGKEITIIPEGPRRGEKLLVRPGNELSGMSYCGTLGIVMKSKNSFGQHTFVALTAGHVLQNDSSTSLHVQHPRDPNLPPVELQRPTGNQSQSNKTSSTVDDDILQECGFLIIDRPDVKLFSLGIDYLSDKEDNGSDRIEDRVRVANRHPRSVIERKMLSGQFEVYKRGATTRQTRGYLVEILDLDLIPSVLGRVNSNCIDPGEWVGYVKWTGKENPFGESGDSGSLVYAMVDNEVLPLGIHLGRIELDQGEWHSYFLSLETFCFEANKKRGWDLELPYYKDSRETIRYRQLASYLVS